MKFESAIDVINKYGWHQGNYGTNDIGYCAIGAVYRKHNIIIGVESNECTKDIVALRAQVAEQGGFYVLVRFNDDPHTTKEDIILLMKKAGV